MRKRLAILFRLGFLVALGVLLADQVLGFLPTDLYAKAGDLFSPRVNDLRGFVAVAWDQYWRNRFENPEAWAFETACLILAVIVLWQWLQRRMIRRFLR